MPLNEAEKKFINSIRNKIEKYDIPTTLEEALKYLSGIILTTRYNNATTEEVDIEIEKFLIRKSVKYFIKKYGIISMPGYGYIPFDMYYIQEKSLEEFQNNKFNILLKTRQIGASTITSLFSLWKMLDEGTLHVIDIISATGEKAKEFKKKMNPTLDKLPLFLFPKTKDYRTGEYRFLESLRELPTNNMTQLELCNGSKFKCETASENAGRSDSLSLLILDEAAFFKTSNLIDEIWKSAGPTLSKTKGDAIIISTPNGTAGKGEWYYKMWNEAKSGSGEFNPIEIDWWEIPDPDKGNVAWLSELARRDYFKNSDIRKEGVERGKFEEENIDGNLWLKRQKDVLGIITFKQEILHDFITMGESIFASERLKLIDANTEEPIIKDELMGEVIRGLWIWEYPVKERKYIIAVDSSRGSGKDASAIQVIDPMTYSQVAEFRGFISTKRLGVISKKIAKYYNNAYLVVECNNLGEATFNEIYYDESNPYENIYRRTTSRNGNSITIGWDTTPALRRLITDEFVNFINDDKLFNILKLKSKRLYDELCTWVWDGGKPTHASGMHDDLILAFCIGFYNRNKINMKDGFIVTSTEEVDYANITLEDIQMMKENYTKFDDDNKDIHELEEDRKRDKMVNRYGVDYYDYSWLLGFDTDKKR